MNTTARHLRPYLVREWPALAGASVMTILLTFAELARPWPLKIVIDQIFDDYNGAFTLTKHDWEIVAGVAGLVIAISLLDAIGTYYSDLWMQSAGERIAHRLRVGLYDHLQRLSLGFHLRRQKGDLLTRVTGDVNAIGDLFSQSIGTLAQSALLLIGMLAVTFVLDPVLAIVISLTMPVLGAVSFAYRRRVRASSRRQRAEEGEMASRANEALSAMSVVKAFGSEGLERERVRGPSARRMAIGIEVSRLQARFDGLVGVLVAIGTAAVVVLGVQRVASGALTPGDLVVFAAYAGRASQPMRRVAREATRVSKTMARADRIAEILSADDVLVERPGAYRGARARGHIVLEHVSFGYEPARQALRDVSLEFAPGERIAVIGPSGAGKSTLGALVARFYDPTAGRVLIDGRDARDCDLTWLREQVGVLLQDTVLFTGTVEENIAYASEASSEEVVAAARTAAAHDFIASLPEGYETELGPLGVGLSGGQRQRLGIARTILRDPPILVLDEPTTALDIESETQVLRGLARLMRGRTTLIITHSLALARTADRVAIVDAGRIVSFGTADEVLGDGALFRRLAQARSGD